MVRMKIGLPTGLRYKNALLQRFFRLVSFEFLNLYVSVEPVASILLQVQPAPIYLFITFRLNLVIRSYLRPSHLLETLLVRKSL
jgi:hypothetical protein